MFRVVGARPPYRPALGITPDLPEGPVEHATNRGSIAELHGGLITEGNRKRDRCSDREGGGPKELIIKISWDRVD